MNLKGRLLRLEAARSARTNEIWPKILPFLENAARPGASADMRARAYEISKILRTVAHRAPLGHGAIAAAEKLCAYLAPLVKDRRFLRVRLVGNEARFIDRAGRL